MPTTLSFDPRREPSTSRPSSLSPSVITLKPNSASALTLESNRGTSPTGSASVMNEVGNRYQSRNLPETYHPGQLPHKSTTDYGAPTDTSNTNLEFQSSIIGLSGSPPGSKRHLSFSKRFSFSSHLTGAHRTSPQDPGMSKSPESAQVVRSQRSMESLDLRNAEASLRSNWTARPGGLGIGVGPDVALPSRSLSQSPRLSLDQYRRPATHDPYDYRNNTSWTEEPQNTTPNPIHKMYSQEDSVPRRILSRRGGQEQSRQVLGDRITARTGVENLSSQPEAQPFAVLESRTQMSSSASGRTGGQKDKKSMLSKALQRANDAVALDNAQDYNAAIEAYEEACDYLSRVMGRSSNEEDKRRLMGIRTTYTTRIDELQHLGSRLSVRSDQSSDSASQASSPHASFDGVFEEQTATQPVQPGARMRLVGSESYRPTTAISNDTFVNHTSELSNTNNAVTSMRPQGTYKASTIVQEPPAVAQCEPSLGPVSPMSSSGNLPQGQTESQSRSTNDVWRTSRTGSQRSVQTVVTTNSTRPPSQASSNHSLTSVNGIRRKHLRMASGDTEAEFDAALDAAVEAVYDEGYEPLNSNKNSTGRSYHSSVANNPLSYSFNSFAEREAAILTAHNHSAAQQSLQSSSSLSELESDPETDEEERMLDTATREFMAANQTLIDDANITLTRQSDSSGSSGRTWASSGASSLSTIPTPLSPVDEVLRPPSTFAQQQARYLPPAVPPPTAALPRLPSSVQYSHHPHLQDRRWSGHRVKRLQIKTVVPSSSDSLGAGSLGPSLIKNHSSASHFNSLAGSTLPKDFPPEFSESMLAKPATASVENTRPSGAPSQFSKGASTGNTASAFSSNTPGLSATASSHSELASSPESGSPDTSPRRSNSYSLSSANAMSSASPMTAIRPFATGESSEIPPDTPVSFGFTVITPPVWKLPTPAPTAGMSPPPIPHIDRVQLFANDMHMTGSPDSPYSRLHHPPRPLEPCPESCLLRPFWLLRCIYQTIAHPRGGYITKKLFIPCEVWKTKNLKIRAVEDKIAACDMLTPALLKLGHVNTLDADAVLEEFQALEAVMDQVQTSLSKKLGSDVGVQHISSFFKDAPPTLVSSTSGDKLDSAAQSFTTDASTVTSTTGSFGKSSGKSSFNLSSWRKLRSKNSSTSLSASFSSAKDMQKENLTMSSLPMAGNNIEEPVFRGNRRSLLARPVVGAADAMKMEGPNGNYMAALARLCEAVQVLDQIARQVEDPGLKASSPTHVGLELSARHAAEFFGFYICRFVLQDVTNLADKFVKRASEWVML